jgi:asparagine synthase (glutamine-hydrolysing)
MGICGIVTVRDGQPVEPGTLENMVTAMSAGRNWSRKLLTQPHVNLGAAAPSCTISVWQSPRALVVCDADVLNLQELYSSPPSQSASGSAAEAIGRLYLEQGMACLRKLRGSFSVAIWDAQQEELFLAVDQFRIKSLCFASIADSILFAPYPSALFASERVEKQVDLSSISSYINFHVVLAPQCAFLGVTKILPGYYVSWKNGVTQAKQYWDLQYTEEAKGSVRGLAEQLYSQMADSVAKNCNDIPAEECGCFLSGGTDSSSVAGLVARAGKRPVRTFSIGFGEDAFNELGYAHIAQKHFATQHHDSILSPEHALDIIPDIVAAFDEPFANASAIPTYHCCQVAKSYGVKVMLAGDGGDELFGGNSRYATDKMFQLYQHIPGALRRGLIEPMVSSLPASLKFVGKARRYIHRSNIGYPERSAEFAPLYFFPADQVLAPGMPYRNGQEDLLAIPRGYYSDGRAYAELNRQLYVDIKITLSDNDLPKVVHTSEFAGIRVRFPYIDVPLAELSGRLPANLKLRGFEKRYLFKEAVRNLLPQEILQKKKHGFGLPIGVWIRSHPKFRSWAEGILYDPRTYQRGYFQRQFIERLFTLMDGDASSTFYGDVMWIFLMLELWHRHHVENR